MLSGCLNTTAYVGVFGDDPLDSLLDLWIRLPAVRPNAGNDVGALRESVRVSI